MAGFRRIVEDYEARLAPGAAGVRGSGGGGKVEHERFDDGEVQFELRVHGLQIADGSQLEVRLNGAVVATTDVDTGRSSLRLSNRKGHEIPVVRAGDRLEVAHRSVVLLEGIFQPD